MISYETQQALIEFLEWYRSQDQEDIELDHSDDVVVQFIEEVNP